MEMNVFAVMIVEVQLGENQIASDLVKTEQQLHLVIIVLKLGNAHNNS